MEMVKAFALRIISRILSYNLDKDKSAFSNFRELCMYIQDTLIMLKYTFNASKCLSRFIANSSSCTTTELSKLLTSCLTAVKAQVIKYCETVYERSGEICSGL